MPGVTDPVIIPGSAPQFPNFNGALYVGASFGPYSCQSLDIENGASVTLNGTGVVSIFGDVVVHSGGSMTSNILSVGFGGALYINGGTVLVNDQCVFSYNGNMGSGSLSVGGILEFSVNSNWIATGGTIYCLSGTDTEITSNSPVTSLYNVTVENGGTARLSGNSERELFLYGAFTLEPNSEFTLEEPVSGFNTSKISVSQSSTLEGNVSGKSSFLDENGTTFIAYGTTTVESYYVDNRWHFISSPVTSAVSGVFLDLYLKAFDESTNSYTPSPGIISTTYPLGVGQGFETWSDIGNPTISYVGGHLNTGDLSTSFTATDINGDLSIGDGEGWNLIGNPYPSAIDVGTENDPVAGYTWTNIDNTLYAWNGTSWSSFNMAGNGTGVNGGTRYVPSMQGFFLKANDFNPSFGFSNIARLHSAQANYKSSSNGDFEIKLVVTGNGYSDEMIVRSINSATDLFDSKYDAYKLPGLDDVPQLYSKAGTSILSINTLPEFTEESVIPVCIKVGNSGVYKIAANDFDFTEIGLDVYLEDLEEGFIIKLENNANYEFSSELNDDDHRFNLIFKNTSPDDEINSSAIQIFSYDNIVQIRKESGIPSDIYIYDIMGREVITNKENIDNKVELQISNGTGYYMVKIITNNEIQTKKVFIK
ncbi:MAG: T9SS type A sorting domain-containing protein [Bacteroidales bacterium]|nr:T9SS type A sorting domain-containing protein [Bacteroidales bacterium]